MKFRQIHILVYIIAICLLGCSDHNKLAPIPKEVDIQELEKLNISHIIDLYVYMIYLDSSKIDKLVEYKFDCSRNCEDCQVKDWLQCSEVELSEKERILSILQEEVEFTSVIYHKHILNTLIRKIENNESLYLSACYIEEGTIHSKYNFYEYLYILDIEEKRIYVFDYVGENY